MARHPKILISLGDTWVDPHEVVAVDATFGNDDPSWANVRVLLSTGHYAFGLRTPERVVHAVRHPELEDEAEEEGEVFPDQQEGAQRRAQRRRSGQRPPQPEGIRSVRREDDG